MFFYFLLFIVTGFFVARYLIRQYNQLQTLAQSVHAGRSYTMVAMKKKVDLINSLQVAVKNYGDHEKLVHISIAETNAGGDPTVLIGALHQASDRMPIITRMATQLPALRADGTFQNLMNQNGLVEQDIQAARIHYTEQARIYNTYRSQFPTVLFAANLGFPEAPLFDMENETVQEFKSDDGEMLRTLFNDAGKTIATKSRQVGDTMVSKGREMAQRTTAPVQAAGSAAPKEESQAVAVE